MVLCLCTISNLVVTQSWVRKRVKSCWPIFAIYRRLAACAAAVIVRNYEDIIIDNLYLNCGCDEEDSVLVTWVDPVRRFSPASRVDPFLSPSGLGGKILDISG